jgi:excisionase family DNA binding protein
MEANQRVTFEFTHEESKEFLEVMKSINAAMRSPAKESNDNSEFLDAEQAAKFLKIAKQTLYQLNSQGKLPSIKKEGKLYFKKADLLDWLNSGKKNVLYYK